MLLGAMPSLERSCSSDSVLIKWERNGRPLPRAMRIGERVDRDELFAFMKHHVSGGGGRRRGRAPVASCTLTGFYLPTQA